MSTTRADELTDLIDAELDQLIELRHDLHAHPELGYQEHRTSDVVQRTLGEAGVNFVNGLAGGTGVMGHLPGRQDGAVGLRADMDALPIHETTGLPYASTVDGCMHACGHDGHTTILLGTARVLAKIAAAQALPRPVSLVFQPAEEGGGGGKRMVEDGCLDGSVIGPAVSQMFGLHGWPGMPLGHVGTKAGALLAASDTFDVTVRGIGAHAAFPHVSHDPLHAACAVVTALQSIVSRNVDPLESAVLSVTTMHGGTAHNIIPDAVTFSGTVRTLNDAMRTLVPRRLREISESVATAHGCTADVTYTLGYPVTFNDAASVDDFERTALAALGEAAVDLVPAPFMGGEDFAYYGQQVPACFFLLGLRPPDVKHLPELHQPNFNFNDDAIAVGIEMFCRLALRD